MRITFRRAIYWSSAILMLMVIAYVEHAYACSAFLESEEISGFNKICYYDHLGDRVALNIKSTKLCPLTIQVRH